MVKDKFLHTYRYTYQTKHLSGAALSLDSDPMRRATAQGDQAG